MNNKIVLIGNKKGEENGAVDIEYTAMSGDRTVRIPASIIGRMENVGDGRIAMVINFDDSENGQLARHLIGSGAHSPMHSEVDDMMIVEAMEHGEPLPNVSDDKPDWPSADSPSVQIVGHVADPINIDEEGPFDEAFLSGGRENQVCDWDFDPVLKPAFVLHDTDDNGQVGATIARVNNGAGQPAAFHIFNPDFISEKRPMGAHLNTVSERFYPKPYRDGFSQIMKLAAENGWPAKPIATHEGGRASLYCDVTSSIDWSQVDNGGKMRSGDYRVGFTVSDSLDGSSAFKVQAVAMRVICSNGMVLGGKANLISMKHTVHLKDYDFEALAEKINAVILTAMEEIVTVDGLKDIGVARDTFEKLMTLCERKGLITKPKVTRDDAGQVTGITGAHMWRLMGQGWTQPSEPWVAVNNQERGSLFHVYNILTGAVTHKPEYRDTDGTHLKGRVLSMDAVTDRLGTIHTMLTDLAAKADEDGDITGALETVPMFSEIIY